MLIVFHNDHPFFFGAQHVIRLSNFDSSSIFTFVLGIVGNTVIKPMLFKAINMHFVIFNFSVNMSYLNLGASPTLV